MNAAPTLEKVQKLIGRLSVEDQRTLLDRLSVWMQVTQQERSVPLQIESEAYGRIEGRFYFAPLLAEVCRRFQQNACAENDSGKRAADGPSWVRNGNETRVVSGSIDASMLVALEIHAANLLSDPHEYRDFFLDALERFAGLIEDDVITSFENEKYHRPTYVRVGKTVSGELRERRLIYAESRKVRRDKIWKPALRDDRRLAPGPPRDSKQFLIVLKRAVHALRLAEKKVTQSNLLKPLGLGSVRTLQKKLKSYDLRWKDVKLW